jgi:hypothetical protein
MILERSAGAETRVVRSNPSRTKTIMRTIQLTLTLTGLMAAATASSANPPHSITLTPIGTYASGVFDQGAAEIVAHDPKTQRLFVVTCAFIGLERVGGVMVYDITNPFAPFFVDYVNFRDFATDVESPEAGDLGPEGLVFIEAKDSPNGKPLLVVGNEVSGTTTVFEINRIVGR